MNADPHPEPGEPTRALHSEDICPWQRKVSQLALDHDFLAVNAEGCFCISGGKYAGAQVSFQNYVETFIQRSVAPILVCSTCSLVVLSL